MALTARNITFRYPGGKTNIIENFSCSFGRNKVTAVSGPNGVGKSTLAKILVGIHKPQDGQISVDGKNIEEMSLAEVGLRIGFVMQNPGIQLFSTSVKEEACFGLKNMNLDDDEIENRSMEYLSYFGLCDYLDKFPYDLSVGEKQRLVLASVMAMEPGYLILDEPTSALDYGKKKELGELLLKLKTSIGTGIILISHDVGFVNEFADENMVIGNE